MIEADVQIRQSFLYEGFRRLFGVQINRDAETRSDCCGGQTARHVVVAVEEDRDSGGGSDDGRRQ